MLGKTKTITLILTQTCNLSCSYCYEDNKNNKQMDFETAKKIIDKELDDDRFESFYIDLFGGEPFLRFPLCKEIVDYVLKQYPDKKILFTMSTNGILVRGEVKEWLVEHKDKILVALSTDGTPEMHNINRCNSYSLIDVDFFRDTWPTVPMKMTVSPETLGTLAEGVIYMHEHNYEFSCNLAFDIDWSNPENEGILERELKKLIDYYLEHPDVPPCQLFEYNFDRVAVRVTKETSLRACGAGVEMITYSSDGKPYPCQFFTPLSIGEEASEESEKLVFKDEVTIDDFDEPCHSCPVITICHNCYGANFSQSRNIYKKDMNICHLNKILFKAAGYLWIQKYKKGDLKCSPTIIPQLMKGVQIILEELE